MKSVILAGGLGSRMAPATANINKHLLPVYSSQGAVPMLYYPISTLVKSGSQDILIISSREHCGRIIEHLSDGKDFNANFTYKIQDSAHVAMGIASALKLAREFTGNDPFAVVLGDNFFADNFEKEFASFSSSDADADAKVFLKEVEDINRFGCATVCDGVVTKIVEKPENPESNWAVTGLYLYKPNVYDILPNLILSHRKELEISDVNAWYANMKSLEAVFVEKFWSDMGTPESIQRTQKYIADNQYRI